MTQIHLMFRAAVTALSICAVGACSADADNGGSDIDSRPLPVERTFNARIDTLWQRGGPDEDTVITESGYLAVGGGLIYLSQPIGGLIAFDAAGRIKWHSSHDSSSQAFIRNGAAVAVINENTVVVADRGDSRLVRFNRDGSLKGTVPVGSEWLTQTLCAPSDSTVLLAGNTIPYAEFGKGGQIMNRPPFPWPALEDSSVLVRYVLLSGSVGTPGCVVALGTGPEFAILDGNGEVVLAPYIERVPPPVVSTVVDSTRDRITTSSHLESRISAAERIASSEQFIAIAFGGQTPRRDGLVDFYDRHTGRYLTSVHLGAPIDGMAASGDTLYAIEIERGTPALVAMRILGVGG